MKFDGFIGPTYNLPSPNVDAQRCVNLYPEIIESGKGKEGALIYYRSTPGLRKILEIGEGPIRLTHIDSIGRILVVSGNELYRVSRREEWTFKVWYAFEFGDINGNQYTQTLAQATNINTTTDVLTVTNASTTARLVSVSSSDTMPTGLSSSTNYYMIPLTSTTFALATSVANVVNDVRVDITAVGTGNLTITEVDNSSAAATNFSIDGDVDYDTNIITDSKWDGERYFYDGQIVYTTAVGTPLPGGLSPNTLYYIHIPDPGEPNQFQICTSLANVASGTEIDLTEVAPVAGDWYVDNIKFTERISATDVTFGTSVGPISAASSSVGGDGLDSTTIFCDGTYSYVLYDRVLGEGVVFEGNNGNTEVLNIGLISSSSVTWIDGYYIVNKVDTNKFFVSGLNDVIIDALSFSSSEGDPDLIVAVANLRRDLWIFNEKSTEVYVNTGNPDFPFERVQGGFIEKGCLAPFSVAKVNESLFWLGRDELGSGMVFAAKSLSPQRISTHAVESAIASYVSPETAKAYTYQANGHYFYVLSFAEATWVYDLATGMWHERAYTNDGTLERHRLDTCAFSNRYLVHLGGDYATSNFYILDQAYYSDNGDAITRMRTFPHLSGGLKRVRHNSLEIDMEVGVGLETGQGSDPQAMLDYSDDGGHTWSSEDYASLGTNIGGIGEYKKRVLWRRLGASRDRIYRLKITDPVKVTLIGAEIMLEEGVS